MYLYFDFVFPVDFLFSHFCHYYLTWLYLNKNVICKVFVYPSILYICLLLYHFVLYYLFYICNCIMQKRKIYFICTTSIIYLICFSIIVYVHTHTHTHSIIIFRFLIFFDSFHIGLCGKYYILFAQLPYIPFI